MNTQQRKTLAAIFRKPTVADLKWAQVVSLIRALGGVVEEREGSRVVIVLKGVSTVTHKPHPRPEMAKFSVEKVRAFLKSVGVKPGTIGQQGGNR